MIGARPVSLISFDRQMPDPQSVHAPNVDAGERGSRRRPVLEAAIMLALVVVVVRLVLLEPFSIPSSSMAPTLLPGDRVLVDKITSRSAHPRRRDLVVFVRAGDPEGPSLKRVVGVAGDRIEIRNGILSVNDRPIRERYVDYRRVGSAFYGPVRVAAGRVFVLGDKRANSRDSRVFGSVPKRDLVGRAVVRFWPLPRAGTLGRGLP